MAAQGSSPSAIAEQQLGAVEAPAWVDAGLVQRALAAEESDGAMPSVREVTIRSAIGPGENYASTIYRLHATLDDGEKRSLVLKILPKGELMAKSVQEAGFFEVEIEMFTKHIPAMQALLEDACPSRFPPFAARCLLHSTHPEPFLALEDLSPQGFRLAERRRGLGLRHSLMALRTLARFHAASAALLREHPAIAEGLHNPWTTMGKAWQPFTTSALQMTTDVCRQWQGFQEIVDDLEKFQPNAMKAFENFNNPIKGKFNVILHGDFKYNNFMYKYDEGVVADLRMVDLQVSHVASPAIDLLYFLYTSVSEDVSQNHEQLLLREYHAALDETLRLLGLSGPSFQELMADVNVHGTYSLFAALGVLPVLLTQEVLDVESSIAGDTSGDLFRYQNPVVQRWLRHLLTLYKSRGWLSI